MPFYEDRDEALRAQLLDYACGAGAGAAECVAVRAYDVDVALRAGKAEDATSAESFGVGLRVFMGRSSAFGSSADCSAEGLRQLAVRVVEMAKAVPPDAYARMAERGEYAMQYPDIELCETVDAPDIQTLLARAKGAEEAALGVAGVEKSDGASAGYQKRWIGISSSNGFSGGYAQSGSYVSVSVIAGKDDGMESDAASAQACFAAELEDVSVVGQRAGARTVAKLNPQSGKTGQYPIIYDRRVSASLLRHFARCIMGPRLAKQTSCLNGRLGAQVFADGVRIVDDPLKNRGARSAPFDAEGLPVKRRNIVENGVLQGVYLDLRSAGRLEMMPTGSAVRGLSSPPSPAPSNLWIEPSNISIADMIAGVDEGFLVTDLMGASISLATGDYSRGASGFWIKGGKIAYPVAGMTIAGQLPDMFKRVQPADDLEFRDGIDAPSLLVEGMTCASK